MVLAAIVAHGNGLMELVCKASRVSAMQCKECDSLGGMTSIEIKTRRSTYYGLINKKVTSNFLALWEMTDRW